MGFHGRPAFHDRGQGWDLVALIACPECEREGVSTTAVSCPDCGADIQQLINPVGGSRVNAEDTPWRRSLAEASAERRGGTGETLSNASTFASYLLVPSLALFVLWHGITPWSPMFPRASGGDRTSGSAAAEPQKPIRAGDEGILSSGGSGDLPCGIDQAAHDRLYKLVLAKDGTGLAGLVSAGRVIRLSEGTRIKVIEPGIFSYEIRVLNGPHAGRSCLASSDWIRPAH